MCRVLLADDHPEVRSAIQLLIANETTGCEVIGVAANAPEMKALVQSLEPDVVLLDWELAGLPGESDAAEMVAALQREHPGLRVIVLSGRDEARASALKAGVAAFVSKCEPSDGLLEALDCDNKI